MSYYFIAYLEDTDSSNGLYPKHFRNCVSKIHPLVLADLNLGLHILSWQKITKKEYGLGSDASDCGLFTSKKEAKR